MTSAGTVKGPVGSLVDVDHVVVGADSKVLSVRGESHNLNPFLGVLEESDLAGGVAVRGNADGAVVSSNCDEVVVDSDSTGALGVRHAGEGRGTALSGLLFTVGDLKGMPQLSIFRVPLHDLVVITGGDN